MATKLSKKVEDKVTEQASVVDFPSNVEQQNGSFDDSGENEYTFDFLAGYTDVNGVTHTTFTLREMTGRDEEAVNRGDIKGNLCRAISTLLARTCTSIGSLTPKSVGGYKEWEKIIKNLYVGDQDYMMVKLRQMSFGDEIEVTHQCPNPECRRKLTTTLSIEELPIVPFSGIKKIQFELPRGYKDKKGVIHKEGVMRHSTGLDREILVPISRSNIAKAETSMLVRLCSFNDGYPIDEDVMASLVMKDREYLRSLLKDNLFGVQTEINISCPDCGTDFVANLNAVNFI